MNKKLVVIVTIIMSLIVTSAYVAEKGLAAKNTSYAKPALSELDQIVKSCQKKINKLAKNKIKATKKKLEKQTGEKISYDFTAQYLGYYDKILEKYAKSVIKDMIKEKAKKKKTADKNSIDDKSSETDNKVTDIADNTKNTDNKINTGDNNQSENENQNTVDKKSERKKARDAYREYAKNNTYLVLMKKKRYT